MQLVKQEFGEIVDTVLELCFKTLRREDVVGKDLLDDIDLDSDEGKDDKNIEVRTS